jgi:iron(III) transport system permease protein
MMNFTNALETLSIPLIFGEPAGISLLMPLLYKQAFGLANANYGIVAAASLLLLAVVISLLYVQSKFIGDTQRFRSVSGKASRKSLFDIGRLRWPATLLLGATAGAFIVLPMAAIFLRSFVTVLTPLIPVWDVLTLGNYPRLWTSASLQRAILNSVLLGGVGGAIAVGFAGLVALVSYRSEFRFRTQLEYIAMIPRAVPGMIAGISFLYTILLIPGVGPLRSTLVIFVIAYTARFLPTALGALYPSFTQIGQDLDRSARVMGADWWTSSRRILLPLMMPAMLSAYVLIFVQTMREYSMALFLVAPGSEVLSIALLQAWTQGDVGLVSALSVVQTMIIAIFILVAGFLFKTRITA